MSKRTPDQIAHDDAERLVGTIEGTMAGLREAKARLRPLPSDKLRELLLALAAGQGVVADEIIRRASEQDED